MATINNNEPVEFHLPVHRQTTLIDALANGSGLSKQRLKMALYKGAVWLQRGTVTERVRRAKRVLNDGDVLHLYYSPSILQTLPATPTLISDQGDYSIWAKPYGMLSQGSKWGDHCTLTRWVETHLADDRQTFLVHRLDRAAQGLMVVAHNKKTTRYLAQQFKERLTTKEYKIIVPGNFSVKKCCKEPLDGKTATSLFTPVKYRQELDESLVAVTIETGRKHQIRRHAAFLGYPVMGDRLYGASDERNLQLVSVMLGFTCPLSHEVKQFRLDPPLLEPQFTDQ